MADDREHPDGWIEARRDGLSWATAPDRHEQHYPWDDIATIAVSADDPSVPEAGVFLPLIRRVTIDTVYGEFTDTIFSTFRGMDAALAVLGLHLEVLVDDPVEALRTVTVADGFIDLARRRDPSR